MGDVAMHYGKPPPPPSSDRCRNITFPHPQIRRQLPICPANILNNLEREDKFLRLSFEIILVILNLPIMTVMCIYFQQKTVFLPIVQWIPLKASSINRRTNLEEDILCQSHWQECYIQGTTTYIYYFHCIFFLLQGRTPV